MLKNGFKTFSTILATGASASTILYYNYTPIECQQDRMRDKMSIYVKDLQSRIVEGITKLDDSKTPFRVDKWQRKEGGEGISCVLQNGNHIEKAGVGVSIVHGNLPPAGISQMRANHKGIPYDPDSNASLPFSAVGLSLIIHPRNPFCPTVHANYRYFELYAKDSDPSDSSTQPIFSWFGGGSDLTPIYLNQDDAKHFHSVIKHACDKHDSTFYQDFKQWADKYFYIPHRKECRGVGGIFFDDLTPGSELARRKSPEELFGFIRECGDSFLNSYIPIVEKRKEIPYTEQHKRWQELRRGRYVEFNLVHDRGTKFGLNQDIIDVISKAGGARIESILMSLPSTARWEYMTDVGTLENTPEGELQRILQNPVDWV
ncbi:Coproporphyrinogen oxidase [Wallemia mellicola]|nr:Coproporphyrinogen oxidase [Wallemia mellicola]